MEHYTISLRCNDIYGKFKHLFLLSHYCPINLLGRDMGFNLVSSPDGIIVTWLDDSEPHNHSFVKYSPDRLNVNLFYSALSSINDELASTDSFANAY